MATTEEAIQSAMGLYEEGEGEEIISEEPIIEPEEPAVPAEEPPSDEYTPKYLNYQEWVDAGKDPDEFRGKNAFDDFGEKKEIRDQLKTLTEATLGMKRHYQNEADQRVTQARNTLIEEIADAEKEEDFERFKKAQNQLNEISQPQPEQEVDTLRSVVTSYITKNPLLDRNSRSFNPEVFSDWSTAYDNNLMSLLGGDATKHKSLTDDQLNRSMLSAMRAAKTLSPDRFSSPRNRQVAPTRAASQRKPASPSSDYEARLKGIPSTSLNKSDRDSALELYREIKYTMKNPKAADKYAKDLLGDK